MIKNGGPPPDEAARVAWLKRVMRVYRSLLRSAPARVAPSGENSRISTPSWSRRARRVHLSRAYSFGGGLAVRRERRAVLVRRGAARAWGIVLHAVPYQLTAAAVRLLRHTDEEEATDKIAAGLVFYPFAWLPRPGGLRALGGGLVLVVFLAALLPSGFFALAWRERLERVEERRARSPGSSRDRDLPRRLRERRQALAAGLMALARLPPEARMSFRCGYCGRSWWRPGWRPGSGPRP